jgi:hypothetical protein
MHAPIFPTTAENGQRPVPMRRSIRGSSFPDSVTVAKEGTSDVMTMNAAMGKSLNLHAVLDEQQH